MLRRLLILIVLALSCACSSKDDDKNVSGRTQSLATVAPLKSIQAQLRVTRTLGAVGIESACLVASLRGPGLETLSSALMRMPGTAEVPLAHANADEWAGKIAFANPAERKAVLVPGAYTFLWRAKNGGTGSLALLSGAGFPDFPSVVSPSEGSAVAGAVRVEWQGVVRALRVLDSSGSLVYERDAISGSQATLPEFPPGSYQVVLSAQAVSASARWSSDYVRSFEQVH